MLTQIEPSSLGTVKRVTVTTTASDLKVQGGYFYLQNQSADKDIYFKEKNGSAATSANGILLKANSTFPIPLSANTLSVISNGSASLAIIFVTV